MSDFPVEIDGVTYSDAAELAAEMEAWGKKQEVRHRGDRHSADRFNEAAEDPKRESAVAAAATVLMEGTTDAGAAELVAHLVLPASFPGLYGALLDRLEGKGPPLPEGFGLRTGDLRSDLLWLAVEWLPEGETELATRAARLVEEEGPHHHQLALACKLGGDPSQLIDLLRKSAVTVGINLWLLVFATTHLLRDHPDRTSETALALAETPPDVRKRVAEEVEKSLPYWDAARRATFLENLGL